MVSFCGKPLISVSIDALLACGIENIYILYREIDEEILHIYDYYPNQNNIRLIKDTYLKGVVQAHLLLTEDIKYPMVTMDCDLVFLKEEFQEMLQEGIDKLERNNAVVAIIENPVEDEDCLFYVNSDDTIHLNNDKSEGKLQYGGYIYGWKEPIRKDILVFNSMKNTTYSNFFDYYSSIKPVGFMLIKHLWDVDTPEKLKKSEQLFMSSTII